MSSLSLYLQVLANLPKILDESYISAACFTLAMWDHTLTFSDELTYIWRAKFNLTTLSFILNRYSTHFGLGFLVWFVSPKHFYTFSRIEKLNDIDSCTRYLVLAAVLVLGSHAITNVAIALRVYNLWERSKYPTIVIWGGLATVYTLVTIFSILTVQFIHANAFNEQLKICFLTRTNWSIIAALIALFVSDIFMLIMMIFNVLAQPYRHNSDVLNRFRRDGVIGFALLTVLRLLGIGLTVSLPPAAMFIPHVIQWAVNSICLSRLILRTEKLKIEIARGRVGLYRDDHELIVATDTNRLKSEWY
ncbi:hypothetical protein NM688_g2537 [Phlebia brevispora]|uniref:Uncharacterized protein n=1 Tax=Phlebia brevispora TaxID=194682 RepID=A0ACC1T8C7_9APHY|nr:hypothetical protein NM688_g2537 [Phlebia brevispora]